MFRRVLLILLMLVMVVSGASAGDLLRRSIMSSTHDELVAMCLAYGLDSGGSDSVMRQLLMDYFGVTETGEEDKDAPATESKKTTSIGISHSDQLFSNDNVIILSGNVELTFTTEDGTRSLIADTVTVDMDARILEATGSVELGGSTKKDRVFAGSVVSLDWSSLDVIVYEGTSSTTRTNSSGTKIEFYVSGETVSYAGPTAGIIFNNGTIATTDKDPYWSISASKLSLSETDMFVDRAVFRLGRVPVFYFPIFFYPGTTLSFNPAIGLSSDKGAFLTTTYEVYGKYPKLGVLGTKSKSSNSSSSDEETDYTGAITAFLSTDDDTEMIRDGIYYRPLKDGEDLGELETWARKTGSYLAVFADAYEKMGLVAGFDSLNYLLDKSLKITATGAVGYKADRDKNLPNFRYTVDFNFNYKKDGFSFDVKMPVVSDPYVRTDFLNRNTGFAIDALLGSEQYFPSGYSSVSKYTWSVTSSYSKRLGNFSFNLSSLKADIDFKIEQEKDEEGNTVYKKKAVEASLPYLTFSSDGTFFSVTGSSTRTTRTLDYTNALAGSLASELQDLKENGNAGTTGSSEITPVSIFNSYSGPTLNLEETTVSEAGSMKMGYSYNQTLDNIYKEDLEHDSFYTKGNGTVYVNAALPGKWLTVTETVKPEFNFSRAESGTKVDEFYLSSELKASIPKVGVSYTLSQKVYNYYLKETTASTEKTDRWGEWNKTDVTAHNISFSQKLGSFSLGFYFQFKPLTETMKPSVGYSKNGFSLTADFSMKRPSDDEKFIKDVLNVNLSYSSDMVSASLANKYDFTKVEEEGSDKWKGYSLTQKLTVKPMQGLTLTENSTFSGRFELGKLQFSAAYVLDTNVIDLSTSASISFKSKDFTKESLGFKVKLSQDKITVWKGRIGFEQSLNMSFDYDFENPYRTSFTIDFTVGFAIAEFLDLAIGVSSANKTFARYYENGSFSFGSMIEDLVRSFDFFGEGRKNTGFNLNSFKVSLVHYMRDWDLHVDAQGSMTTKYSNKYEWVPTVTVYIKWNAIPELKTQGNWDSKSDEWT